MNENRMCPECGGELKYETTWDGCLMFSCNNCLATWQVYYDNSGNEVIERYFFG